MHYFANWNSDNDIALVIQNIEQRLRSCLFCSHRRHYSLSELESKSDCIEGYYWDHQSESCSEWRNFLNVLYVYDKKERRHFRVFSLRSISKLDPWTLLFILILLISLLLHQSVIISYCFRLELVLSCLLLRTFVICLLFLLLLSSQ